MPADRFGSVGVKAALYDAKHRCLYIPLKDNPKQPVSTDVQNGLLLDYDADGELVGVEALLSEPLRLDAPTSTTRTGNTPSIPVIVAAGRAASDEQEQS